VTARPRAIVEFFYTDRLETLEWIDETASLRRFSAETNDRPTERAVVCFSNAG
jgi:hypothetical protein